MRVRAKLQEGHTALQSAACTGQGKARLATCMALPSAGSVLHCLKRAGKVRRIQVWLS